jgi:hypothetical protein
MEAGIGYRIGSGEAIVAALVRFPVALGAALSATALASLSWGPALGPWLLGLAGTFAWAVAIRLALEARFAAPGHARGLAPWAAVLSLPLIVMIGATDAASYLWPAGGALAALAAPILGGRSLRSAAEAGWARAALWAAVQALAIALPLCGGLSLLALGADALFDLGLLRTGIFAEIWHVGILLILPWCALALLPRLDPAAAIAGLPRWPRLLLDGLLAPMALAFAALLNAYCLFILARGELPKGVIGPMVLAFALAGGAVWSLTFGDDRTGPAGRLLRRLLLPGLAAPAVALLIAAWQRVEQHGVTEYRYLLLLLGALLLALAALQLVTRRIPSPSRVAFVAAAALLAASGGPWSASAVAIDSQLDRLERLIGDAGHLRDGGATALGPVVPRATAAEIVGVLRYLVARGERQAVVSRFHLDAAAGGLDRQSAAAQAQSLARAMGVEPDAWDGRSPLFWQAAADMTLPVSGFDYLVRQRLAAAGIRRVDLAGAALRLELSQSGGTFSVSRDGTLLWRFDLRPLLDHLDPLQERAPALDAVAADGTRLRLSLQFAELSRSSNREPRLEQAELILLIGDAARPAVRDLAR